jgi:hypothetical protein
MSLGIYALIAGVATAFLASNSWLRRGNPSHRKLRQRWDEANRDEKWSWLERERRFAEWQSEAVLAERPMRVRFIEILDVIAGLACVVAIATALGLFDGRSGDAGSGTAIGDGLTSFAIDGMIFIALILFVCVPVFVVLDRIEAIAAKLVIYALVGIVCGFIWVKDADLTRSREPARQAISPPLDPREREALVERLRELDTQTRVRWRQDIDAANAKGPPGLVPPMLQVTQPVPYAWQVANRSDKMVCVSIARVRAAEGAAGYERCPSDNDNTCREIAPGGSRQFAIMRNDQVRACLRSQLEFRVGTPQRPEPSFWSDSALQDFDTAPPKPAAYADLDDTRLRDEIALLEKLLAERDRASRWRRELDSPAR